VFPFSRSSIRRFKAGAIIPSTASEEPSYTIFPIFNYLSTENFSKMRNFLSSTLQNPLAAQKPQFNSFFNPFSQK